VLRAPDRPPAWGSAPAPGQPSAKHRWRLQCRSQPPVSKICCLASAMNDALANSQYDYRHCINESFAGNHYSAWLSAGAPSGLRPIHHQCHFAENQRADRGFGEGVELDRVLRDKQFEQHKNHDQRDEEEEDRWQNLEEFTYQPSRDSHRSGRQPSLECTVHRHRSPCPEFVIAPSTESMRSFESPSLYLLIRGHAQLPSLPPPEGREHRQPERQGH
jgi:hypothetical protein